MSREPASPLQRAQVVGISVVGAITVICYALSLILDDPAADTLRTIAVVTAGICAVIGVSFAFTGGSR